MFRFGFVIAIVASVAMAGSAAGAGLHDVIERYEQYEAGEALSVSGFRVDVGHAVFTTDGTVVPLVAGDERIGLLLIDGSLLYTTPDTDEHTAVRFNAKHNGVKLEESKGALSVTVPFRTAVLFGTTLPELEGTPVATPAADLSAHREVFHRQRYLTPVPHLFAQQALSNPAAEVAIAQINGKQQPFVYEYDSVHDHQESLHVLQTPYFSGNRNSSTLYGRLISSQPIGRTMREAVPQPDVDLTHVDVTLVASNGTDATLSVVETLVARRPGVGLVRFQMYDDYVFDVNKDPRRFNVRQVIDAKGRELPFHHQDGNLVVQLAESSRAGQKIDLRFEIDGDFLYRPDKSQYWELGIEPWFPWLRENAMSYTYHSLIKVQRPFVPFGSGTTIRREVEGDYNVLETKLDKPVSWVAILAGKYHFTEETRDGKTVRVASFISKNHQAAKTLTSLTFAAIDYYPFFLGPFPFDELTIIEKNDLGYGQAPAGIVFITKEAFQPKFEENNPYVEGINMRFAHEIAHQYWGHVVKMESLEDQWIEEAFADYSAALFMKAAGREHDYKRALATWKADGSDAAKVASIPMANRLSNPGDRYGQFVTRQGLIYAKGAYLLAAIHDELGDEAFLTFLKSYQASFRWKRGSTRDVIGLLSHMTKKDWSPFFERYFYGTEMPRL